MSGMTLRTILLLEVVLLKQECYRVFSDLLREGGEKAVEEWIRMGVTMLAVVIERKEKEHDEATGRFHIVTEERPDRSNSRSQENGTSDQAMTEEEFVSHISQAEALLLSSGRPEYYRGYIKGLTRFYRGASVETVQEHEEWLRLSYSGTDLGRGYRDGLQGIPPWM
jgi:hypothetical protein